MSGVEILVVEDDKVMRSTCLTLFRRAGYAAHGVADAMAALQWLGEASREVIVLSDVRMPGPMDGMDLLTELHSRFPDVDVVIMTGFGSIESAVEAMKRGAADYVTKPFNKDELLMTIGRIAEVRDLKGQVDTLREGLETRYRFEGFIAASEAMRPIVEAMVAAARSSASLLLTGESGTGKDVAARLVHFNGDRAAAAFVPVNCASLPGELIESELFGHLRGAYTGAAEARLGLIRQADGGTLLLDEITEMPTSTQAKLLRVLQEKVVRPVGSEEETPVDFRLITSTNRPVEEAIASGYLREDLYYRIGVLQIELPPLRDRREDIVPLFRYFLDRAATEAGVEIRGIDDDAGELLQDHPWRGNVRELSNVAERCIAMGARGQLAVADLQLRMTARRPVEFESPVPADTPVTMVEAERRAVENAMAAADGNKSEAARILGIARKTLYKKLRRADLDT